MQNLPPILSGQTQSFTGRKWALRDPSCADKVESLRHTGLNETVLTLLCARGINPEAFDGFLSPSMRAFMPDPSSFADMDKAAGLILDALLAKKNITVFADYDVDGGTSAAQLIRWARHYGTEFGLYIPDRILEGYGPNKEALEKLKSSGADLVITVDCGAAAHTALEAARDIDLDVIVVDHHLMDDGAFPPSKALVNPNRPDDVSGCGHMAAAGVTFVLLAALNREVRRRGVLEGIDPPDLMDFLGLSALGTLCDVVPLKNINRAIVAQGLKVLSRRDMAGVKALCDISGAEEGPLTPYHGGFMLGPRINAGGRVGQADAGAKLLSTDDAAEAVRLAEVLDRSNKARKDIEKQAQEEALKAAQDLSADHSITIVAGKDWHPGVIGIVASRIKEKLDRPAIVIGLDGQGQGKGSGRSMTGVNLGAAIRAAREEGLLIAGGGHAMAGGLTIEEKKIDAFREFMETRLAAYVKTARQNAALKIDASLFIGAANLKLLEDIEKLAPYGAGNPEPVFMFENVRCVYADRLRGGHVRCTFSDESGTQLRGIAFRAEDNGLADVLMSPDSPRLHVAGRVKLNEWRGRRNIDLQVVDLAAAT